MTWIDLLSIDSRYLDKHRDVIENIAVITIIGLLVGLSYHRLPTYYFTAGDTFNVIASSRVVELSDFFGTFTEPFAGRLLFFRPVTKLVFAFEYAVWGLNPSVYHMTNAIFHFISGLLVYSITRELKRARSTALVAACIFVIHPVHPEIVPAISRRNDLFLTAFGLLSILSYMKYKRKQTSSYLIASIISFALSLLSKEIAIIIPAIIILYDFLLLDERDSIPGFIRARIGIYSVYTVIPLAYIIWRTLIFGGIGGYEEKTSPMTYILYIVRNSRRYFEGLIYPSDFVSQLPELGFPILFSSIILFSVSCCFRSNNIIEKSIIIFGGALPSIAGIAYWSLSDVILEEIQMVSAGVAPTGVIGKVVRIIMSTLTFGPISQSGLTVEYFSSYITHIFTSIIMTVILLSFIVILLRRYLCAVNTKLRNKVYFLLSWIIIPFLFIVGTLPLSPNNIGYQNLYFTVAPLSILMTFLISSSSEINTNFISSGISIKRVTVVLVVILFIFPSPLLHTYSGWETSGDISEKIIEDIESEVVQHREEVTRVQVAGLPRSAQTATATDFAQYPHVKTVGYSSLGVKGYLEIRADKQLNVTKQNRGIIMISRPTKICKKTSISDNTLVIRYDYLFDNQSNCPGSMKEV